MSDDRTQHPRDDRKDQPPGQGDRLPGLKPGGPGGGVFIWIVIFGLLSLGVYTLIKSNRRAKQEEITLSAFYERLDDIQDAQIRRNIIMGSYRKGVSEEFDGYRVSILDVLLENIVVSLREYNDAQESDAAKIDFDPDPGNEFVQFFLIQMLPILLILLVIWFLLARQFRSAGGAGGMLSFGKARARLHTKEKSNVTFDQVAGVDEAKEEVAELVEFLKNPKKFSGLGGRIPRGVMLVGPPGCGKTLLARAIAGEAEVPFFSISGSDFIEMFVGVGASRVRDLFRQAKENAPCILFLDEIDAVGRRRSIDIHGASAEGAQTLNAILVEMDGFETDANIIVIAATNRPDVLDPALRRPGRFDRQVEVDLPDIRGREAILRVHANKYKLDAKIDLRVLARGTPGFSGADLEALLNEAALLATRQSKKAVAMDDLEEARDKVRWGRQRRSRVMSDQDRKITAFHESGHAIASKLLPDVAQPLHKVSIVPQGMALGMTMSLPDRDRYNVLRKEMLAELCVLIAGRVSEEMFCDDISSGAENDLDRATTIARNMVCRWGMSEAIGPVSFQDDKEDMLYGREMGRTRSCSEATAIKIDDEVSRLLHEAQASTQALLAGHRAELERLTEALLKYEVLYAVDVDAILAGEEIVRNGDDATADGEDATGHESSADDPVANPDSTSKSDDVSSVAPESEDTPKPENSPE